MSNYDSLGHRVLQCSGRAAWAATGVKIACERAKTVMVVTNHSEKVLMHSLCPMKPIVRQGTSGLICGMI